MSLHNILVTLISVEEDFYSHALFVSGIMSNYWVGLSASPVSSPTLMKCSAKVT